MRLCNESGRSIANFLCRIILFRLTQSKKSTQFLFLRLFIFNMRKRTHIIIIAGLEDSTAIEIGRE